MPGQNIKIPRSNVKYTNLTTKQWIYSSLACENFNIFLLNTQFPVVAPGNLRRL